MLSFRFVVKNEGSRSTIFDILLH